MMARDRRGLGSDLQPRRWARWFFFFFFFFLMAANIVQADIEASNGVIHVIDAVIMPGE